MHILPFLEQHRRRQSRPKRRDLTCIQKPSHTPIRIQYRQAANRTRRMSLHLAILHLLRQIWRQLERRPTPRRPGPHRQRAHTRAHARRIARTTVVFDTAPTRRRGNVITRTREAPHPLRRRRRPHALIRLLSQSHNLHAHTIRATRRHEKRGASILAVHVRPLRLIRSGTRIVILSLGRGVMMKRIRERLLDRKYIVFGQRVEQYFDFQVCEDGERHLGCWEGERSR